MASFISLLQNEKTLSQAGKEQVACIISMIFLNIFTPFNRMVSIEWYQLACELYPDILKEYFQKVNQNKMITFQLTTGSACFGWKQQSSLLLMVFNLRSHVDFPNWEIKINLPARLHLPVVKSTARNSFHTIRK